MNHENRRLFEEIMKAKAKFGDDEKDIFQGTHRNV